MQCRRHLSSYHSCIRPQMEAAAVGRRGAPALDDFITRLVAAATGQAPLLNSRPGSNFREMSGGIIEDWFMMPATSLLAIRQKFERIVNECRGEVISRSEMALVFAIEGVLPFWKLFGSKQRTLKTTVMIEATGEGHTELFKVGVRIEPLIVDEGQVLTPVCLTSGLCCSDRSAPFCKWR